MKARSKFLIGSGIIVVTLLALAYVGFTQSKTYYHTIAELQTLQGRALKERMRVGGTVAAGSIRRYSGRVDFVLEGEGKALRKAAGAFDQLRSVFHAKLKFDHGSQSLWIRGVNEHSGRGNIQRIIAIDFSCRRDWTPRTTSFR